MGKLLVDERKVQLVIFVGGLGFAALRCVLVCYFLSEPLEPWWPPRAGVGGSDFSVALAIIVLTSSKFWAGFTHVFRAVALMKGKRRARAPGDRG